MIKLIHYLFNIINYITLLLIVTIYICALKINFAVFLQKKGAAVVL